MNTLTQLFEKQEPSTTELSYLEFDKVVELVDKEQMKTALQIIEKSFSEGICDVRFIFYYLYAYFFEKGLKSLQEIFPLIVTLGQEHVDKLVPTNNRETHLQSSLNWFFSSILKKLKYIEKESKMPQKLSSLISKMEEEEFAKFIDVARDFQQFFYTQWPMSAAKDKVSNLVKRLEELRPLMTLDKKEELEEQKEEEVAEEVVFEQAEPEGFSELPEKESPSLLFKSELMLVLMKKMKVFETLIEKQDYLKAAVVSKDITSMIEHFDPCAYFPQVFSKYLALMAKTISEISEEWNQENSLRWNSLDKLYKTDVEQFMLL